MLKSSRKKSKEERQNERRYKRERDREKREYEKKRRRERHGKHRRDGLVQEHLIPVSLIWNPEKPCFYVLMWLVNDHQVNTSLKI